MEICHPSRRKDQDTDSQIVTAVRHLNSLADRMKSSTALALRQSDVSSIDVVIEAINDLEMERAVLHDQLEAESIKCSILRHELKFLPDQYRREIHDAVVNARQSNSDLVKNLSTQLKNIEKSIEELTLRQEQLDADNTTQLYKLNLLNPTPPTQSDSTHSIPIHSTHPAEP